MEHSAQDEVQDRKGLGRLIQSPRRGQVAARGHTQLGLQSTGDATRELSQSAYRYDDWTMYAMYACICVCVFVTQLCVCAEFEAHVVFQGLSPM